MLQIIFIVFVLSIAYYLANRDFNQKKQEKVKYSILSLVVGSMSILLQLVQVEGYIQLLSRLFGEITFMVIGK
ncbi:hypothetical protein [Halalkalibacter akibai]|uniref:Uncharacterized protein n=1 Tax=Halalkalibacter akibai (strain ATCC 43226 / DSM 21942 / CIP 109018 / JCM 9157 / 1139) TaxID=1236973 RepID=W4QQN2_HALA3|nr:hypothetical protein [Halalkalibacter akibai]GAE34391.1 hypothetical protein JCM9157_1444 [Halalkalibacter akibai JCM 9157]